MRILIRGGSFENKGAETMLATVQTELASRLKDLTFFVDSPSVAKGTEHLAEARNLSIIDINAKAYSKWRFFLKAAQYPSMLSLSKDKLGDLYRWQVLLNQIDVVIDVGGYAFGNTWGLKAAQKAAELVELSRKMKVPFLFLPQTWGPFDTEKDFGSPLKKIYQNASLVVARDTESRMNLAHLLNISPDLVEQAPDIAFGFSLGDPHLGKKLLEDQGLQPNNKPLVAVVPNVHAYDAKFGFLSQNSYIQCLVKVCRQFIASGCTVLVLTHKVQPSSNTINDRVIAEVVRLAVNDSANLIVMDQVLAAHEYKSMIACCDFLVGSRFHSLIAALHSRIPAFAIGWAHKYKELMTEVGLASSLADYRELTEKDIIPEIFSAWEQRTQSKQQLQTSIPLLEQSVHTLFDRVAEMIMGYGKK